jgi:putative membrane protein
VKNFAAMMISHHSQAKEQQSELLRRLNVNPVENPKSAAVRNESARTIESLKGTSGTEFDRAYIDVQVNEHQHVLDAIDNELLPNAKNADLRAELLDLRPRVQAHLTEARDIQQELASRGANIG